MYDLADDIFRDENKARQFLEAQRWPDGPICPHCGVIDRATLLKGKSTRRGLYKCRVCEKPFTVRAGTVYECSKIPLHKWLLATVLFTSSRKGFSSRQLQRQLDVTYQTAWFMTHRMRAAMASAGAGPLSGECKMLPSDEIFGHGKNKKMHRGKLEPRSTRYVRRSSAAAKCAQATSLMSTAMTLRDTLSKQADRKSALYTA